MMSAFHGTERSVKGTAPPRRKQNLRYKTRRYLFAPFHPSRSAWNGGPPAELTFLSGFCTYGGKSNLGVRRDRSFPAHIHHLTQGAGEIISAKRLVHEDTTGQCRELL